MADNGMFLNFSVPDTAVTTDARVPKFKGGSWKERRRLTNNVKNKGTGRTLPRFEADQAYVRATKGVSRDAEPDFNDPRPAKRRREDGEFSSSATTVTTTKSNTSAAAMTVTKKPLGSRPVISSLFSYNPQPQHAQPDDVDAERQEPAKPSNAPLPDGIDTFTSLGLSTTVAAHLLTKMDLKTPTAIQKAAMMQLLKEDSDAFIQSETGSGKTLAYLLPIVQRIMGMTEQSEQNKAVDEHIAVHRDSGLFAIILAPTRELCKQISVVLEKLLGCAHYIVAGTVIGGEKKKSEKARLRKGLNILVATPGRLVDHLENTKSLVVSNVRFLVLDEGDRLMDLGFEEDITKIVRALDSKKRKSTRPGMPEDRMTMLCSATLKMNVQKLGDISLKDAVLIKGDGGESHAGEDDSDERRDSAFLAPAQLKQSYVITAAKLRLVTLTALLRRTFARKGSVMKAIVFVSCADSVEFHFTTFTRPPKGEETEQDTPESPSIPATTTPDVLAGAVATAPLLSQDSNPLTIYKLHGSLPQATRTAIVKSFANTSTPSLLIATDVASRGLDLPNLDLVIEYDPAFSTDEHLHRIGRTARLGRDGRAVIFLQPGKEENYVDVLKQSFKKDVASAPSVTSQLADDVLRKGFTPTTGVVSSSNKEWESKATEFQLDIERWILSDPRNKELAKRAFQSHIRAYATHVANERKYFDIKDLHLGHLAKSFGLRDPPTKVNVAGMRSKLNNSTTTTSAKKDPKARDPSGTTTPKTAAAKANESRKRKQDSKANNPNKIEISINSTNRVRADTAEGRTDMALARQAKADIDEIRDADDAAQKMRELVRNRKRMMGGGADEFNLA